VGEPITLLWCRSVRCRRRLRWRGNPGRPGRTSSTPLPAADWSRLVPAVSAATRRSRTPGSGGVPSCGAADHGEGVRVRAYARGNVHTWVSTPCSYGGAPCNELVPLGARAEPELRRPGRPADRVPQPAARPRPVPVHAPGRDLRQGQGRAPIVSRAVVIATGITENGGHEVPGVTAATAGPRCFGPGSCAPCANAG
jgi:hypothetical protein